MAKAWEQYVKEMYKRFGYLATWTPGVKLQLGDVGEIKDKRFTRITTLENLKISFKIRNDDTQESQKHSSSGSVSMLFKAAGTAPQVGSVLKESEAGFTIDFKKNRSTVYEATGCTADSIDDQVTMGSQIIQLFKEGKWNKDWAVVTELVSAESGTVLISNSSESRIELAVKGKITAGVPSLADVEADLQIAWSKNMQTTLISQAGLTPLFRARALKSDGPVGPFGSDRLTLLSYAEQRESALLFDPVTLDLRDDDES